MKIASREGCAFEECNCSWSSLHGPHWYSCVHLHLGCTLCILYMRRLTYVGCPLHAECLQGIFNLWPQRQTVGQDRILSEFLFYERRVKYFSMQHRLVAPWGSEKQDLPRDVRAGSGSQGLSHQARQLQGSQGTAKDIPSLGHWELPWGWGQTEASRMSALGLGLACW